MTEPMQPGRPGAESPPVRRRAAGAGFRRRGDGQALGARAAAHQRRAGLRNGARPAEGAGRGGVPAAGARDDRRGAARSRRAPAHGARAPIRGQGPAGGRSRARGGRAGDRAVAGSLGTVLDVPEAAARGRSRAPGRQAQDSPARAVRRQAARARARPRPPRGAGVAVARAARVLPARRDARMRGHRGLRQPAPQRRRHLLLFDVQPRAAARARRSLRDVGETDRAHGSLARDVGAQGLSLRAAARNRGPRHPDRSRRRRRRDARRERAREHRRRPCASATPASSPPACAGG